MSKLKKLTLLHSNDLHGDFIAETVDEKLIGGVSMLSGYINKVRNEEENVIYAIAGDMFRGSVIDSEFKGISTIEIMNLIAPDVVAVGNHEVDYGVPHLLFLEKCSKFPIINANLFIRTNMTRLFRDHYIVEIGGMKILFIAIITEEVLAQTKSDLVISTFLDVGEAADEVGKICDTYNTLDIDFTVLLTHIGFEDDKELAAKLRPEWGVDVIIGGHSHTLLEQPEKVNDILIVQAGVGTDQIGRFDIVVDTDTNSINRYTWRTIPITEDNCPRDYPLEDIIANYQSVVDKKYGRILTRLSSPVTHPSRTEETSMGNLICDVYREMFGADIVMIGSGSLRVETLGPIVRMCDLAEAFPYNDVIKQIRVTGEQLKLVLLHIFRDEAFLGHTEFYQFSYGLKVIFDKEAKQFIELSLDDVPINDSEVYSVALQGYHLANMTEFLSLDPEDVEQHGKPKMLAASCMNVLEEGLSSGICKGSRVEGRLVII